jgi:hypothetical protein
MWGKLTERSNRTSTKIVVDPEELYRFLVTPGIEVVSLTFCNDDVLWASWRYIEEEKIPNLRHTNEVIGAYVTAGARLHLYTYLDRLQQRAMYCDTDSVIFVQPSGESALVETGDNLGAMSSELNPSECIEEFVCGGPKNYAYKVINTGTGARRTVCKVRRITLNYNASLLVNFDVIRGMILGTGGGSVVTVHTEHKIKRRRQSGECAVAIVTEPEDKKYGISFFKRRRLGDQTRVPFGYKM